MSSSFLRKKQMKMNATSMTKMADATGTSRFKLANNIRTASSPDSTLSPELPSSRAGAIVPVTSTIKKLMPRSGYLERTCVTNTVRFTYFHLRLESRIHIRLPRIQRYCGQWRVNGTTLQAPNRAINNSPSASSYSRPDSTSSQFCQISGKRITVCSITSPRSRESTYFFLYSITKYNMGQPPSFHAVNCNVTVCTLTTMNSFTSGNMGFDPEVLACWSTDWSPVPILQENQNGKG